jgi:hypothetical protein
MGDFFILWRFMLKKLLLSLGIIFTSTAALADGIETPRVIKPNFSGDYTLRATLFTTNNANGLKFTLHKYDNNRISPEEYPSVFRPSTMNTRSGEKRSVVISFKGPFDKPQNMAMCMFTDPPRPEKIEVSTMVANFRYCKVFQAQP